MHSSCSLRARPRARLMGKQQWFKHMEFRSWCATDSLFGGDRKMAFAFARDGDTDERSVRSHADDFKRIGIFAGTASSAPRGFVHHTPSHRGQRLSCASLVFDRVLGRQRNQCRPRTTKLNLGRLRASRTDRKLIPSLDVPVLSGLYGPANTQRSLAVTQLLL